MPGQAGVMLWVALEVGVHVLLPGTAGSSTQPSTQTSTPSSQQWASTLQNCIPYRPCPKPTMSWVLLCSGSPCSALTAPAALELLLIYTSSGLIFFFFSFVPNYRHVSEIQLFSWPL